MYPPIHNGGENINKNSKFKKWFQRYGTLICGYGLLHTYPLIGMLFMAIWFVQFCWMMVSGMTWFIGLPTFSEQITLVKAVCEEKKRREDFENSLIEQQLQALNSAVASAVSNRPTSS